MPIFERLRAQEQIPCAYPLQMGAGGTAFIRGGTRSTPLSPHAPHCHPSAHWVSYMQTKRKLKSETKQTQLNNDGEGYRRHNNKNGILGAKVKT